MRYIDITALQQKRGDWGNSEELWTNPVLKNDYRLFFHNKCWYTEVELVGQDVHIDHFRPKDRINKYKNHYYNEPIQAHGYNWLRNDPLNYRACCIYSNRITGGGGKGSYFPLKDNSPCLSEHGTEQEEPLLLDPCNREDVNLLTFMGNNVACSSSEHEDIVRVEVSTNIYNYSNPFIGPSRAKVWEDVEKTLEEYNSDEISRAACVRRLKDAVSRDSRFSACAIACVKSQADDDIKQELNLEL